MAPHSSTLAWKIPWMEEPGGLQSMGLWRVGHDWATSLSLFTFMPWRRQWQPTPVFLENPRDRGAWWAAIYGVAQTRLKRLSSSSHSRRLLEGNCLLTPPSHSRILWILSVSQHNFYSCSYQYGHTFFRAALSFFFFFFNPFSKLSLFFFYIGIGLPRWY